ncbi:uncharacterized protein LOC109857819 [Pseudomyrmex gracilis]|uniref:uncharacterized protein LOC109857819 n=1 Tax=Pseudomyrmex gracilis TaxID=219809 RepID=UPI000995B98C|nr:uncharacterized protein LOC109857819 [Pseudomyrmex gracilis]
MFARRSIIGRSLVGYLAAVCVVSLSTNLVAQIEGRKCVCTSKVCKEAGVDTCRTRFFCYTELILTNEREVGENTITRGCTEGATPLLCETKSSVTGSRSVNVVVEPPSVSSRILATWPRLKCCDSHNYCNAAAAAFDDDEENVNPWTGEKKTQINQTRFFRDRKLSNSNLGNRYVTQSDQKYGGDPTESADQLLRNRVKALHVAALVLAFAALISVLASCYVVTRFLKSNRYVMDAV